MSDFSIEFVHSVDQDTLNSENFKLWIWYADKIPPHIGCSGEGKYFSLKVSGMDLGIPVEKVFDIVQRKKIVFLMIDLEMNFTAEKLHQHFRRYKKAGINGPTCLTPICDLVSSPSDIGQLSSLLKWLKDRGEIVRIQGVNLPANYSGLPVYGKQEIQERLEKLSAMKTNNPH
jgi:hypothetical protein